MEVMLLISSTLNTTLGLSLFKCLSSPSWAHPWPKSKHSQLHCAQPDTRGWVDEGPGSALPADQKWLKSCSPSCSLSCGDWLLFGGERWLNHPWALKPTACLPGEMPRNGLVQDSTSFQAWGDTRSILHREILHTEMACPTTLPRIMIGDYWYC